VKLLDFGMPSHDQAAGRRPGPGIIFGTPDYLSPEQALGRADDRRAKRSLLGRTVLFELLTGKRRGNLRIGRDRVSHRPFAAAHVRGGGRGGRSTRSEVSTSRSQRNKTERYGTAAAFAMLSHRSRRRRHAARSFRILLETVVVMPRPKRHRKRRRQCAVVLVRARLRASSKSRCPRATGGLPRRTFPPAVSSKPAGIRCADDAIATTSCRRRAATTRQLTGRSRAARRTRACRRHAVVGCDRARPRPRSVVSRPTLSTPSRTTSPRPIPIVAPLPPAVKDAATFANAPRSAALWMSAST